MKDITDYFTSPSKSRNTEILNSTTQVAFSNEIVKCKNKTKTNSNKDEKIKIRKKKRGPKPVDPDISSNNTLTIELDCNTEPVQEENVSLPNATPTVNAFQFLMNSRNNVIGQNSGGKTCKDEDIIPVHKSKNLNARKNIFKEWADLKGASKRKREEEDIEKCINLKMEKRTKRLKKLLQEGKNVGRVQEGHVNKELNVTQKKKMKRRVKRLISSESDSGNDLNPDLTFDKPQSSIGNLNFSLGKVEGKVTEVVEKNTQDVKGSSTSLKKHKESSQNNLLSFLGVINRAEKEDIIEVFEESPKFGEKEIIKIKMFSPQRRKKRSSLPTLDKTPVYNLGSVQIDESSQTAHKGKKHKKDKHKARHMEENSQSKTKLNESTDDFRSPKKVHKKGKLNRLLDGQKLKKNKVKSNSANFPDKLCDASNAKDLTLDLTIVENAKKTAYCKGQKGNKNDPGSIDLKNARTQENTRENMEISRNKDIVTIDIDDSPNVLTRTSCKLRSKTAKCKPYNMANENCPDSIKSKIGSAKNITQDSYPITINTKRRILQDSPTSYLNSKYKKDLEIIEKEDSNLAQRKSPRKRNVINYNDNVQVPKGVREEKSKNPCKKSSKKSYKDSDKVDSIEKVEVSSGSEYGESSEPKPLVVKKIAPIFLKATSRPKVDAEVIEAKKKFLLSGVPDSLKLIIEKQKSFEEKEYDIFPAISHVQQKCESWLWNLPNADLKPAISVPYPILSGFQGLKCQDLIIKTLPYSVSLTTDSGNIKDVKSSIQQIKSQNPDYPVFKVFRHVHEKTGKNLWKNVNKKTRKRKQQRKNKEVEDAPVEPTSKEHEMWTEKYKPSSSEEILGNYRGVSELRKWLELWLGYSEQINARKRKRRSSNSESEFESTDCDSRDSTRLPGNTMILYGPCGSGKTSAVYAIANELGFNVLEFNASTKRTGKRLLQELQEATQSHQVRKADSNISNFVKKPVPNTANTKVVKKLSSEKNNSDKDDNKKMCILLLEDIDLIFEQDDGFLASLSQLITTSKRPIILTATDNSPPHVQKLISQYECISFMPLSLKCLAVWLQIVCLVEGLLVNKEDLGNLLEYNKGDIRKTLLNVQFWSLSGGQLERQRIFPFKMSNISSNCIPNSKVVDEELPIEDSEEETSSKESFVHKNCLGSFEILRVNEEYSIPQTLDLGLLWWNFPNLLDIPINSNDRLRPQKKSPVELQEATSTRISDSDKQTLQLVLNLYDSLILTDSLFKSVEYPSSVEPVEKNWSSRILDSLELTERREDCNTMLKDLVQDMSHTMVNKSLEEYKKIENTSSSVNMALPDATERRWRANQHICEAFLQGSIPLSNRLERRSVALDYLPALRNIVRSEDKRASSNTKRGNRFRHYLKDFSIDFKPNTCKLACNVLNAE